MQETSDRLTTAFKSASSNSTARTLPAIRELLPISEFKQFHPDPNINFWLNRFLIPGLEQQPNLPE